MRDPMDSKLKGGGKDYTSATTVVIADRGNSITPCPRLRTMSLIEHIHPASKEFSATLHSCLE